MSKGNVEWRTEIVTLEKSFHLNDPRIIKNEARVKTAFERSVRTVYWLKSIEQVRTETEKLMDALSEEFTEEDMWLINVFAGNCVSKLQKGNTEVGQLKFIIKICEENKAISINIECLPPIVKNKN